MEASSLPEPSATGFWSIERFVAFVLGPAATAGSGWLATFLAKKWGIHLSGPEISATFGTGALAAAGLAYKWLHGRQIEQQVEGVLAKADSIPGVGGLIHTTISDLEGLIEQTVERATHTSQSPSSPAASGQ